MRTFRSYQLAIQFYRRAQGIKLSHGLGDQFYRAATSIALNLSEGSAKKSPRDRHRFYRIALGSIRECEAVVQLSHPKLKHLEGDLDILARHVYKLCKAFQ